MSNKQKQDEFCFWVTDSREIIFSIIHKYCDDKGYVDDLFQDVMLRAWSSYDSFKGLSSFRKWICRVTKYTVFDHFRRFKTKIETVSDDNVFYSLVDEPYSELQIPVLESLSEIEKTTLNMVLEGMSYREISELIEEPENRIRVRMHRIKNRLSKQINNTV